MSTDDPPPAYQDSHNAKDVVVEVQDGKKKEELDVDERIRIARENQIKMYAHGVSNRDGGPYGEYNSRPNDQVDPVAAPNVNVGAVAAPNVNVGEKWMSLGCTFFVLGMYILLLVLIRPHYSTDFDPVCGYGLREHVTVATDRINDTYGLREHVTISDTNSTSCICSPHYTMLDNTTMCNYKQYSNDLAVYLQISLPMGWFGFSWFYVDNIGLGMLAISLFILDIAQVSLCDRGPIMPGPPPEGRFAVFRAISLGFWICGIVMFCTKRVHDSNGYPLG